MKMLTKCRKNGEFKETSEKVDWSINYIFLNICKMCEEMLKYLWFDESFDKLWKNDKFKKFVEKMDFSQ